MTTTHPHLHPTSPLAPLSMGFSRQEYWRELPFPAPGDLLDPGIEPTSFESPALAGNFFFPFLTSSAMWEIHLVPQPEIKPVHSAVEARSLSD